MSRAPAALAAQIPAARLPVALLPAALLPAALLSIGLLLAARPAHAGPPYATDDPQPTGLRGFEVYAFTQGERGPRSQEGSAGIDFNYGAAPGLQLTAVLPVEWESARGEPQGAGPGNIELAAKWRFLRRPAQGFDLAFFPRLFLPSTQATRGERHAALLLPLWMQFSGERWSSFGGGGCTLRGGPGTRDPCEFGWAVARTVGDRLQLGAELFHEQAADHGAPASTQLGVGATWDANEHLHLMGSIGPGLQAVDENARTHWYAALLFTW